jgi:hypothetical protein
MRDEHTNHEQYWPGTVVVKSHHNAFNWRGEQTATLKAIQEYERKAKAGKVGGERTAPLHYGQAGGGSY